jgi:hypothetical protein
MATPLTRVLAVVALLPALSAVSVSAQSLPTSQPQFMRIIREEVKFGRGADHEASEARWPVVFERAKSPDYYLAFETLSGATEAWFVLPSASYAAMGEAMARENEPSVRAALDRLYKVDAEFVNSGRTIELRARPEYGSGDFPDLTKQRFWEVTVFQMRPGTEEAFAGIAKAYGAATARAGSTIGYRVYEVTAGMPVPTWFIFSSVASFGDFDKMMAEGAATMKAMTADDQSIMKKFTEGLISQETFRLRVNPRMSYVSKEVRSSDPAFWMPKPPATTKAAPAAAPAKPATQP